MKEPMGLNYIDYYHITKRGFGFVVESIPDEIKDLRDLQGMHAIIGGVEYEITGVETFADLRGPFRTEGPQSILVRPVQ